MCNSDDITVHVFLVMNAMRYWITINIEWLSISSNYLTKGRDNITHKLKRMHIICKIVGENVENAAEAETCQFF